MDSTDFEPTSRRDLHAPEVTTNLATHLGERVRTALTLFGGLKVQPYVGRLVEVNGRYGIRKTATSRQWAPFDRNEAAVFRLTDAKTGQLIVEFSAN